MRIFEWLSAAVSDFRKSRRSKSNAREKRRQVEDGTFADGSTFESGDFASDFDACTRIVRRELNERFPDNYHARLQPGFDPDRNYSLKRSDAIDTSSAAIALALRNGASVSQAAASGSRSIGL